jgi:hypothetical protein
MVVNETINATQTEFVDALLNSYLPTLKTRTIDLILAPGGNPDMLWIVFPLAVSVFFMTLYFGRYKKEELGWNTAFGNSLALLFVAVDLFRQVAKNPETWRTLSQGVVPAKILVPSAIFVLAFFLLLTNFFHIFPKFFAFFISSAIPINLLAYVGIVVVYVDFPFDWITVVSGCILFALAMIIFQLLKWFEPEDWTEKQQALIYKMTKEEDE